MSAVRARPRPRLGFAGVGWIGRHRLEAIEASGAADVAALADPAGSELDVECHGAFDELLELDLDGIVIATPSALHAEQSILALQHGLAVFCQKPLGRDAAETAAVVRAARRADRLLGVDLSYRQSAAAQALHETARKGVLGRIYAGELVFHNAYGPDKPWCHDRSLAGGGCLIDLGTHLVDLALWLLGAETAEVRSARLLSPHGLEVEELALVELDVEGVAVRLTCSWRLPAGRDAVIEATLYGEDAGASLHNVDGSFFDLRTELRVGTEARSLVEPPDDWGGRTAVAWALALAGGAGFDPEVERAIAVARVLDAIYEAGRCAS